MVPDLIKSPSKETDDCQGKASFARFGTLTRELEEGMDEEKSPSRQLPKSYDTHDMAEMI